MQDDVGEFLESHEKSEFLDDDFQNPPSEIVKLVNKINEGYDVVFSFYEKKEHHFFRNLGSKVNNYLASFLLQKPKDLYLSSFKVINRFMIDEIIKCGNKSIINFI